MGLVGRVRKALVDKHAIMAYEVLDAAIAEAEGKYLAAYRDIAEQRSSSCSPRTAYDDGLVHARGLEAMMMIPMSRAR